ncbi:beta-phosphoglucomutase family hydrolase [Cellulomonas humilata]|uniref:Beta-phosphoglucomutase family hydrolase n=1 Tax=Cellulomonas humilata TaxID=144055 RepID=A0A7Y6A1L4_9CELL|nr:beta-phosphoglucomutase family hydrolase [Cellulomonas humilata]NUU16997.1 beta-phosphoglucomutase family hydrolase [Cellulomonas humilata]
MRSSTPAPAGATPPQEAVIFDLDGVVTDTATLHAAAWRQLFADVLADARVPGGASHQPFDATADYRRYVDGRAREDGVRNFLAARGIEIPLGSPDDPAGSWTVHGLAGRKNSIYLGLLAGTGVKAYPGTSELLGRLRAGGVRLALVTASRNAAAIVTAAGLDGVFDVVVDGERAQDLGLPGKPDPAMFLQAANELRVQPARAAVVEDAAAGVAAARRGGFGMVVGVDRGGQRDSLEAAGADVVVSDVAQLDLGSLRADPWVLVYEGFDPAHEGHREALTALGNGYLGTRGVAPERASDGVHYPGTYLAGVYNRLTTMVHDRQMEDESLVNAPNWLVFDVGIGTEGWWSAGALTITAERRELDLRRGVLTRTAVLTDQAGRRLRLSQRRLASMARPHLCGLETTLVAEGWDGPIRVRSGIDAGVRNDNVAEYRELADRHLRTVTVQEAGEATMLVEVETTQSHVRIATAARTTVTGAEPNRDPVLEHDRDRGDLLLEVTLHDGQPVTIDKTVSIFTTKDRAIASPRLAAIEELLRAPDGFAGLLPDHIASWARLWSRYGIALDADRQTQLVLNLHVFHVLQSVSAHSAELDAGVPARGLHGEGYRGHVFWDELFVLPVLTARQPWLTRSLLDYRFRRLDAARDGAAHEGLRGAMFPWQSGSDGREETPSMLFNRRSERWMPDNSSRQRHVGLAIAYSAWRYFEVTGDVAWLVHRGADLIIEVARLFTSLATYDAVEDRFHIDGVMGPDEYHDGYPDAPGGGLRDNAYTNVLAAWVLRRAVEALELTQRHDWDELHERLRIQPTEADDWDHLARRLAVPFHDDGVISQFADYAELKELDWPSYRARYGNIGRLDLILEAEEDSTNRYKLAKQADVLMLVYLLGPEVLVETIGSLGYGITPDALTRTVEYYLARTAHGSTLSRVVHASVLARVDPRRSWQTFRDALAADLDDTQGGTTSEGIHLGAMASTLDIVTRVFAGYRTVGDMVVLNPRLPDGLVSARFGLVHRGQRLQVRLDRDSVAVAADPRVTNQRVRVRVGGRTRTMVDGQDVVFTTPRPRENATAQDAAYGA